MTGKYTIHGYPRIVKPPKKCFKSTEYDTILNKNLQSRLIMQYNAI